jgi:alpha-D-xyloside xylohydrolase
VLSAICFRLIQSGGNEKMKFTEGYWLPSEKANASHAMQAYEVEQIPGGMRILATTRPIEHRGMTLNLPTITVEFVAHTPDTISMEAWHYEAYDNKVPSFDKTESVYEDVTVTINDDEAVLDTGSVLVRVQRKGIFAYTFEADGKVLTGSGFRNLSYIRWDRKQSTMLPAPNYIPSMKDVVVSSS